MGTYGSVWGERGADASLRTAASGCYDVEDGDIAGTWRALTFDGVGECQCWQEEEGQGMHHENGLVMLSESEDCCVANKEKESSEIGALGGLYTHCRVLKTFLFGSHPMKIFSSSHLSCCRFGVTDGYIKF